MELWSDSIGTIKTVQTIISWSNTEIIFNVVRGSLTDGEIFFVITDSSGIESAAYRSYLGFITYPEVIQRLSNSPDIYHRFNNSYVDEYGIADANSLATRGSVGFVEKGITRDNTHCFVVNGLDSAIAMIDTIYTNDAPRTLRMVGGWIELPEVYTTPACIVKEGGSANNAYMVIGFGNVLLGNISDSFQNFKVQAYSDFKLKPNRPYHICWRFVAGENFTMFVDGIQVSVTDGNPIPASLFSTHSADWIYGDADGGLDTGGTDVGYSAAPGLLYSDWATWSDTDNGIPPIDQIRTELFEKGAVPTLTIGSDTQVNQQAAIDAISGTVYEDVPLAILVSGSTDTGNLVLDFDNIKFGERTSIHVQFMGNGTLTINNINGSNVDSSKCSSPSGAEIIVNTPSLVTITGLQPSSEVRIYEAGTQNEIGGQESVTSGSFSLSVESPAIDVVVLSLGFQNLKLENLQITSDIEIPVQQILDRQYQNN